MMLTISDAQLSSLYPKQLLSRNWVSMHLHAFTRDPSLLRRFFQGSTALPNLAIGTKSESMHTSSCVEYANEWKDNYLLADETL